MKKRKIKEKIEMRNKKMTQVPTFYKSFSEVYMEKTRESRVVFKPWYPVPTVTEKCYSFKETYVLEHTKEGLR